MDKVSEWVDIKNKLNLAIFGVSFSNSSSKIQTFESLKLSTQNF